MLRAHSAKSQANLKCHEQIIYEYLEYVRYREDGILKDAPLNDAARLPTIVTTITIPTIYCTVRHH